VISLKAVLREPAAGASSDLLSDLDPALAGLARAVDPADVARRFERRWPGSGPARSITSCSTEHIRWTPGTGCIATYRFALAPAHPLPDTTMGVVDVSLDGDRHFLYDSDSALRGLTAATDPRAMQSWLAEQLGHTLDSCAVTPVSYRPGERCVLRYDLSHGEHATVLYGKLLAGHRAFAAAATIEALGPPTVPALVAVAPEWELVIQADGGRRSASAGGDPESSAVALNELADCGRLLARLHARNGPLGRMRRIADDVDELTQYLVAAELVCPSVAAGFSAAVTRLRAIEQTPEPAVPSHGAFRLNQVCFAPGGPSMIDLDGYCWAERARDLANFLAYLKWRAIRRAETPGSTATVRGAVLSGYMAETASPPDCGRLQLFEAVSLLKIAGRRYHRLAVDEWDRVPRLIEAATACLDGAGIDGSP